MFHVEHFYYNNISDIYCQQDFIQKYENIVDKLYNGIEKNSFYGKIGSIDIVKGGFYEKQEFSLILAVCSVFHPFL